MNLAAIPRLSSLELAERYDLLLFDAYGVLVDARGPIPGAIEMLAALEAAGRDFIVVTNDASRRPATCAAYYQGYGVPVSEEQVITAGGLVAEAIARHQLQDQPVLVLGTRESQEIVAAAGAQLLPLERARETRALVLCDDRFSPFKPTLDALVSGLARALQSGVGPTLILANPDVLFPSGDDFGIAAGAVAALIEAALAHIRPANPPRFERLGKPEAPIFEAALRRARERGFSDGRIAMVGDQLATDILGARRMSFDAILVDAGLSRGLTIPQGSDRRPDFILDGLGEGWRKSKGELR